MTGKQSCDLLHIHSQLHNTAILGCVSWYQWVRMSMSVCTLTLSATTFTRTRDEIKSRGEGWCGRQMCALSLFLSLSLQ